MQNKADNSKRARVDKNKTMIFIFVAIASVVAVASLMISRGLWSHANYMNEVIAKKEKAYKQLQDNKVAVAQLAEAYEAFDSQFPNLLGGSPEGVGPRDGSNATLILDSLPNKYDFPALVASLEKLLEGYVIDGISGSDDIISQEGVLAGAPVEIPFSFEINTNYDSMKLLLETFNKSIRPFQIAKMEIRGSNDALRVSMEARTYYQPEMGLQIKTEVVR